MIRLYQQMTVEALNVASTIDNMTRSGWTIAHYAVSHSHPQHPIFHHFIFERFEREKGGER